MCRSGLSRLECPKFALLCLVFLSLLTVSAEEGADSIRSAPVDQVLEAPPLSPYKDDDKKQRRNYPEQPPIIPHSIDGYEISLRGNKCLACHSRQRSVEVGAPMASISHFMNQELQVLSEISPRRYFCNQCHVPQTSVNLPVSNEFIDSADLPN